MSDFNIKEVIQKSTADVSLEHLANKGFKKVRVLNKDTINQLIAEAVHKVINEKIEELGQKEREEIAERAKGEFQSLVSKHQRTESKLEEYQQRLEEYQERMSKYQEKIAEYEVVNRRLQEDLANQTNAIEAAAGESKGSHELKALAESIEKLGRKIGSGGGGGSAASVPEGEDTEIAIKAMLRGVGEEENVESNVGKVEVKNAKASGVSSVLDKLKTLKQGGG